MNAAPSMRLTYTFNRYTDASGTSAAAPDRHLVIVDLPPEIPGAETEVTRYEGCRGGAAELWTVRGGDHFVAQHPAAFDAVYDYLTAHPKPAAPSKTK